MSLGQARTTPQHTHTHTTFLPPLTPRPGQGEQWAPSTPACSPPNLWGNVSSGCASVDATLIRVSWSNGRHPALGPLMECVAGSGCDPLHLAHYPQRGSMTLSRTQFTLLLPHVLLPAPQGARDGRPDRHPTERTLRVPLCAWSGDDGGHRSCRSAGWTGLVVMLIGLGGMTGWLLCLTGWLVALAGWLFCLSGWSG